MLNSKEIITTKQDKPYIELNLNDNYTDFNEFYRINKEIIYKSIIELFKGLTKTRKKALKLVVITRIDGFDWGTDFIFNKNQFGVLIDFILPFFEEREEYEICSEIVKIHKILDMKNKKNI
jgi:hypothetical protein